MIFWSLSIPLRTYKEKLKKPFLFQTMCKWHKLLDIQRLLLGHPKAVYIYEAIKHPKFRFKSRCS